MSAQPVLVAGGTGHVGRKVVAALVSRGTPVRALVRPGSDAASIESAGVTIVRGDMFAVPAPSSSLPFRAVPSLMAGTGVTPQFSRLARFAYASVQARSPSVGASLRRSSVPSKAFASMASGSRASST